MKSKWYKYIVPLLLLVLMFISNFLDPELFKFGSLNFAVWFLLSTFAFACGWYINKTLGWQIGGKLVFAIAVAGAFISILLVTFFNPYFRANALLIENIILFVLRNVTLGAMGFFGLTVAEVLLIQRETLVTREKLNLFETRFKDANKESELVLREAKLKAERILFEAESNAKNLTLKKERIERELKEFIQSEKELIKKYEEQ